VKAQRAITELGLMGGWYLLTGSVALAQAADRGRPPFGLLVAGLGALVIAVASWVIVMAVRGLRDIQGLPETAKRRSWLSVAAGVSLSSLLPIATVVLLSTLSTAAGWGLGLAYVVLGAAVCATAVLAGHVERLCGARVWRANNRFYFAR
jgi:hypothetical protein